MKQKLLHQGLYSNRVLKAQRREMGWKERMIQTKGLSHRRPGA